MTRRPSSLRRPEINKLPYTYVLFRVHNLTEVRCRMDFLGISEYVNNEESLIINARIKTDPSDFIVEEIFDEVLLNQSPQGRGILNTLY